MIKNDRTFLLLFLLSANSPPPLVGAFTNQALRSKQGQGGIVAFA
ncbi:hypothetical protein [Necropsobacter massiliensis]|nr:hypothetical protein [Necropsobacter massiliensis]